MIRLATQVVRALIPIILFQFIAPAFLPDQEARDQEIVCFETQHVSLVSPSFLKEIEPEVEWEFACSQCHTLLDFTQHFDNVNSLMKRSALWNDLVMRHRWVLYFTLYRAFRI